jgi:hypothetical protein
MGGGAKPRNTVWLYVETTKPVDDRDYIKVFASEEDAECWSGEHDPKGAPFECLVVEGLTSGTNGSEETKSSGSPT